MSRHICTHCLIASDYRAKCCGAPVVTFGEKLGQSIIQVLRVSFAYFLIVCVNTMNIWLLIAVVVGAAVGYGVGKPLLANSIDDSVTSHGYTTASLSISSRRNNRSERSKSWRYQQVNRPDLIIQKRPIEDDETFTEDLEGLNDSENTNNGADVIWIRRSTEELRPNPRDLNDVFDDPDVKIRTPEDSYNVDSIRSEGRESSRSDSNRFRSTSKIINDSFRSYKSDNEMRKYSTSASTSANVSFDSQTLDSIDNRKRSKRSTSKVSRNASTASGGRFKPVSREINRHMSFNDDLR